MSPRRTLPSSFNQFGQLLGANWTIKWKDAWEPSEDTLRGVREKCTRNITIFNFKLHGHPFRKKNRVRNIRLEVKIEIGELYWPQVESNAWPSHLLIKLFRNTTQSAVISSNWTGSRVSSFCLVAVERLILWIQNRSVAEETPRWNRSRTLKQATEWRFC